MKRQCISIRTFDRDDANWYIMNTSKSLIEISELLGCTHCALNQYYWEEFPEAFRKERKKECYRRSKLGDKNPMKGITGELHPRYKGSCSDGKGYILVLKPDWFIGRPGSNHIFEHQYVYCKGHGLSCIPDGYVVHHLDNNPLNNTLSNLELLSKSEHTKLHCDARNKSKDTGGGD